MKTKQKFALEDFRSSIKALYGSIAGNLILLFLLIFPDVSILWTNEHTQFCVLSILYLLLVQHLYDWKTQTVNFLFLFIYLLICGLEYAQAGLPGYAVSYDFESYQVGKGIMMDILIWTLPPLYMAIRVFLVIPMVMIILQRKKLQELSNKHYI